MSYVSSKSLKDSGSSVYVERFIDGVDYTSGTTTTLTTTEPMPAANSVWVYFDGVVQHHSEYGVSGYSIIFTSAIPTATDNVEIQFNKLVSVGVAGENTVTNSMMTAENITSLLRKNAIINGNFDIWQRDTTQTITGYGSDDRWVNENNGSTKTHSQQTFTLGQTDVPNNPTYYSRTVVSSVADASNYTLKWQRIESVLTFSGEAITLSFWAKADATKNIAVEFTQDFGSGGTPSSRVTAIGVTTINLTTTWQKYTVTLTLPSITGKTLGTDGRDALFVGFWFEAGTTFDARTNSLGQQSGTFDISQVQLEKGDVATDFEERPVAEEFVLCRRYYQVFEYAAFQFLGVFRCSSAGTIMTGPMVPLGISMRTAPSASLSTTPSMSWKTMSSASVVGTGALSISGLSSRRWYFFGSQSGTNALAYTTEAATSFNVNLDAEL